MLTWLEIDTKAIRNNINAFRSIAANDTSLMIVVKANAYGHGLDIVAPVAAECAEWLGVNSLDEALRIRSLGISKPVAILGYTELDRMEVVAAENFRQVVYRTDAAESLSRAAQRLNVNAQIHLKIETGTNRQGITVGDLAEFGGKIRMLPNLNIEGIYTHFANIEDTLDPAFAQRQMQRFKSATATLEGIGIRPEKIHAAATAGMLLYPETEFSMVRIGIGTYGIWPSRETHLAARERGRQIVLQPALTWKTRVVQLKRVNTGEYVGYGTTYQASHPLKVAVLPVGYFDGYDRKLSNIGRVLVRGRAVPVIGRIAMNMMMLDVSDVEAELDDEVVLLGRQGDMEISAEELAEKSGTISYETLSRINPQIPRSVV